MDGADFRSLKDSFDVRYGAIEYTSIDSRRNWCLALSGQTPEGDRHEDGMSTALGVERGDVDRVLPEVLSEKGYSVASVHIPGMAGSDVVEENEEDYVGNLPEIDYFKQFAQGEKTVMDVPVPELVEKCRSSFNARRSLVEQYDDMDVVFAGFSFADSLNHAHLHSYTDYFLSDFISYCVEEFDDFIIFSDHTITPYYCDRSIQAKHDLPAQMVCSLGFPARDDLNIGEKEFYSFLKKSILGCLDGRD